MEVPDRVMPQSYRKYSSTANKGRVAYVVPTIPVKEEEEEGKEGRRAFLEKVASIRTRTVDLGGLERSIALEGYYDPHYMAILLNKREERRRAIEEKRKGLLNDVVSKHFGLLMGGYEKHRLLWLFMTYNNRRKE